MLLCSCATSSTRRTSWVFSREVRIGVITVLSIKQHQEKLRGEKKPEPGESILTPRWDIHRNMITVAEIGNKSYQTACRRENMIQVTGRKARCMKLLRLLAYKQRRVASERCWKLRQPLACRSLTALRFLRLTPI